MHTDMIWKAKPMPTTCTQERRTADALRALGLDADPPARNGCVTALARDAIRRLDETTLCASQMDLDVIRSEVRTALRIADVASTVHGDPDRFWTSTHGQVIQAKAADLLNACLQAEQIIDVEPVKIPRAEYVDAF